MNNEQIAFLCLGVSVLLQSFVNTSLRKRVDKLEQINANVAKMLEKEIIKWSKNV